MGRNCGEACAPVRLLGIDLPLERLPAAPLIKRRVVRFAKQQREIDRAFVFQRLHGSLECDAGIPAAPEGFAGRDPADAAGAHLASIPYDVAAKDADMAGEVTGLGAKEYPQVGMSELDLAPGKRFQQMRRPNLGE